MAARNTGLDQACIHLVAYLRVVFRLSRTLQSIELHIYVAGGKSMAEAAGRPSDDSEDTNFACKRADGRVSMVRSRRVTKENSPPRSAQPSRSCAVHTPRQSGRRSSGEKQAPWALAASKVSAPVVESAYSETKTLSIDRSGRSRICAAGADVSVRLSIYLPVLRLLRPDCCL